MDEEPFEKIFPTLSRFLSSYRKIIWQYTDEPNFESPGEKYLQVYVDGYSNTGSFRKYIKSHYLVEYTDFEKTTHPPTPKMSILHTLDELIEYVNEMKPEIISDFEYNGKTYEKFTLDSIIEPSESQIIDYEANDTFLRYKTTEYVNAFKNEMGEFANRLQSIRDRVETYTLKTPDSFVYIHYRHTSEGLIDLFDALCRLKYLSKAKNTPAEFVAIFSGKKIDKEKRIVWLTHQNKLCRFIKLLFEQPEEIKGKGYKWIITAKCFVNENGEYSSNVLANTKPFPKEESGDLKKLVFDNLKNRLSKKK